MLAHKLSSSSSSPFSSLAFLTVCRDTPGPRVMDCVS